MSQMTIHVVDRTAPAPDNSADQSASAANTGFMTSSSDFSTNGPAAIGTVAIATIIIVFAIIAFMKKHNVEIVAGRSRWLPKVLVVLAILFSALSFHALEGQYDDKSVNATDSNEDTLSITTEDIVMDVELSDQSVFKFVEDTVKVDTPTTTGYTLSAYVTNPDLAASGSSKKIASLNKSTPSGLSDNTWGVATTLPESQESASFIGLSTDSTNPTLLKEATSATEADDETALYYGTFVTPDLPYGSYTGATITYVAIANFDPYSPVDDTETGLVYYGNDLTFADTSELNRRTYQGDCGSMYIATTPTIIETPNLTNGVKNEAYENYLRLLETKSFPGASRVKAVMKFGIVPITNLLITQGDWGGWSVDGPTPNAPHDRIYTTKTVEADTRTYVFYGDKVTVEFSYFEPSSIGTEDDRYGVYVELYPIYDTEEENTTETSICTYSKDNATGEYQIPVEWYGGWTPEDYNGGKQLMTEDDIIEYLNIKSGVYTGEVTTIDAYNPYKIFYNGNGESGGTMDGFITNFDYFEELENDDPFLTSPNYYKTGYGFAGWSENPDATVGGNDVIYGPNEMIEQSELHFDQTRSATMYAVWVPSEGSIQGWQGCSSMNVGDITALSDQRDDNTYTVAKLADGKCWMTENLRLDAENTRGEANAALSEGYGGVFVGLANSEIVGFNGTTDSNSLYSSSNIIGADLVNRLPRYNNNNSRLSDSSLIDDPGFSVENGNMSGNYYRWYSYGNYYSWAAAKANTTRIINNTGEGGAEETKTSICPTGWRLPFVGNTNDFRELDEAIDDGQGTAAVSSVLWTTYPNNFVVSGSFYHQNDYRGWYGDYLSGSGTEGYTPYLRVWHGGYAYPGTHSTFRTSGGAIRCISDI